MKKIIPLILLIGLATAVWGGQTVCRWNHQPPAEYGDLPRGVGGWTIAWWFFDDVEGANTLGVDKEGLFYPLMTQRRNTYESYYDTRMTDIGVLVDDLNTELSVVTIESKLETIHNKLIEIDAEYLAALLNIHWLMDGEDPDLYDNYIEYLDGE